MKLGRRLRVVALVVPLVVAWIVALGSDSPPVGASPARGAATAGWLGPAPAASDWPQHMRGSYHEGWNQVETALSPTSVSRLAPVWDVQIGDTDDAPNSGSPIVVGDAVYIGGPGVSRFDATTGALVWHTNIAASGSTTSVLTTPAYDRGIVVAATSWSRYRDTLTALNAQTGKVLWKRKLPGVVYSSPSIANGTVYVGTGENKLTAVALNSGAVKWTWSTTDSTYGLVSSPTTDGKSVYFSTGGGTRVWALDAATGAQRWALVMDSGLGEWTMDGFTVSLLAGRVYGGDMAGTVYSIDAATGTVVWRTDLGGSISEAVLATPQAILTLPAEANSVQDRAVAVSTSSGDVLWQHTVPGYSPPGLSTADGVVYMGWSDSAQTLSQIDAIGLTTGTQLARIPLPAPAQSGSPAYEPEPPAISNGRLYVARWQELITLALTSS